MKNLIQSINESLSNDMNKIINALEEHGYVNTDNIYEVPTEENLYFYNEKQKIISVSGGDNGVLEFYKVSNKFCITRYDKKKPPTHIASKKNIDDILNFIDYSFQEK